MKNLFFATIMAASVALFASCQKNEAYDTLYQDDDPVINIELANGDQGNTKSFFDNTATAESFEKKIYSLTIFVFNSNNDLVARRNFSTDEITNKSCSFHLPKTVAGTSCQFYAVANFDASSVTTKHALLDMLENTPGDYNGTFEEVTTKSKRTNGFVMTGVTESTVAQMGGDTPVAVTLKRTVAKIALKISFSDDFEDLYGGILTVLSTTIENAPKSAYIIEPSTSSTTATDYSVSQDIEDEPYALLYIYENEHIQNHGNVLLKINAEYDIDGNFSTTTDRSTFSYTIPITGAGNGVIKRNGYYRITATIHGPEGEDCSLSITASDWESPSTQDVQLGN